MGDKSAKLDELEELLNLTAIAVLDLRREMMGSPCYEDLSDMDHDLVAARKNLGYARGKMMQK